MQKKKRMVLFASAMEKDVTKFSLKNEIKKIEGRPLYATLKPLIKELKKCTEVIPLDQAKGHFYLVVSDAKFLWITTPNKFILVRPPTNPVIVAGSTQF